MSIQGYNEYNTLFSSGKYYHAVLCISGNTQSIYLNGNLVALYNDTQNILSTYNNINQVNIGCSGNSNSAFSGYLDDFRIYNYAMTSTQISNMYRLNRNLIVHYPFDSSLNRTTANYATMIYDASFVGNSATISDVSGTYAFGTGALQLTNPSTGNATSYVKSRTPISISNQTNELSISLWVNTTGSINRVMRLFDLSPVAGQRGLHMDISGTYTFYTNYV
jgi:hypothetical protein